jgi:hypothetical protein
MTFEYVQLIDNIALNFTPVGENTEKLAAFRVKKQLSMRELSKVTGHSRSYLRDQLRKFGIRPENAAPRLGPYGWDWQGQELVENAKEQHVLCEILRLNKDGKGCKSIAAELNRQSIAAKAGGRWGPSSVQNILNRARAGQGTQALPRPNTATQNPRR